MYKLVFEENDLGRQRYEMSFQSIALTQKQVPVAEWDVVVDLVKKLKSVGRPAKEKIGSFTLYDLSEEGGEVILENAEMKALIDFVGQPIWRPLALEDAQELKKWLDGIPKESGKKDGGKPRLVESGAGEAKD
jgi:hypothetical protein